MCYLHIGCFGYYNMRKWQEVYGLSILSLQMKLYTLISTWVSLTFFLLNIIFIIRFFVVFVFVIKHDFKSWKNDIL